MNVYGKQVLEVYMNALLDCSREQIKLNLVDWLLNKTNKKKQAPNLEQKLALWTAKVQKLAENCKFKIENDKVVVIATGDDASTLKGITYGTDWFDPADNVVSVITGDKQKQQI